MLQKNNILFCNGLPATMQSFIEESEKPSKDFVRHFIADRIKNKKPYDWASYNNQLIKPYNTLRDAFSGHGVDFIGECAIAKFKDGISRDCYDTIVLFSHCINNGKPDEMIEFFDGMVTSEEILRMIPDAKERIYDFSVCNCLYLAEQMNLRKDKNPVGSSNTIIRLSIWLIIYAEIFKTMILEKKGFNESFNEAIRQSYIRVKNNRL